MKNEDKTLEINPKGILLSLIGGFGTVGFIALLIIFIDWMTKLDEVLQGYMLVVILGLIISSWIYAMVFYD